MTEAKRFGRFVNAATGDTVMEMMGPGRDEDALSIGLRILTHRLQLLDPDAQRHGFFGGRFGYGVDFENDVFAMHPDWQGDCTCGATEPIHSADCRAKFEVWRDALNQYGIVPSTDEEIAAEIKRSIASGLSEEGARMSACFRPIDFSRYDDYERLNPRPNCADGCPAIGWVERDEHDKSCRLEQHCFTFKATGFTVDWYKYIGRDNEVSDVSMTMAQWREMLIACLTSISAPSLKECVDEYAAAEDEERKAFERSTKAFFKW